MTYYSTLTVNYYTFGDGDTNQVGSVPGLTQGEDPGILRELVGQILKLLNKFIMIMKLE